MAGRSKDIIIWEGEGITGARHYDPESLPIGILGYSHNGAPNGDVYRWNGDDWVDQEQKVGGATSVASAPMESGPIYEDATYMYFAMAAVSNPASALSDAVWQISRMHSTSKRVEYATGASFSHAYTDLSAAQAAFA